MSATRWLLPSLTLALAAAPAAADDGLDRALGKAAADSYAFTVDERPGPGVGGKTEARYQKGRPLAVTADGIEFFKSGDALVYRDGDRWLRSKRGVESDPLRVLGGVAKVNALRLPHEELAELGKALGNVRKGEAKEDGLTVYVGELTEGAAKKLARPHNRDVARGGVGRVWVDDAGAPVKYAITLRLQGRVGNAEVDGMVTKTVTIGGPGKTVVEVPEAARKALE